MEKIDIKRGQIYYVDFGENVGREQNGIRPAIIMQNNIGNKHSPTTIVIPLTTSKRKHPLPTHVFIGKGKLRGAGKIWGIAVAEQMRTVDEMRILQYEDELTEEGMIAIEKAVKVSLGL